MRGFGIFLAKELREIVRTWRVWVLPGIVLLFAVSGPPLAKVTPELLSTLMDGQASGVVIQLPEATFADAYLQWTKNLSQIVLFAVIIMFAGAVSAERRAGTAVLALTKPLSRPAFVLAKLVSHVLFLAITTAVGAALTWALTLAVFGEAPAAPLANATLAWLALGTLFVALAILLSAVFDSQAAGAGVGLGVYLLLSIATIWKPAASYSPAALVNAPTLLARAEPVELGWPLVTTIVLAALLVAAAVTVFSRREL